MPNNQSQSKIQPMPLHAVKALIVDDQRLAATMLKSILMQIGLTHVDTALNFQQAQKHCELNAFDLLLIDYHLDGPLTGTELINLMRRKKLLTPYCGIIMISGDHSAEVILTSMSVEPDNFMAKPITVEIVKAKLTDTMHECALRTPVYKAIINQDRKKAITLCKKQLLHTGYHHKLECLLLDLLIEDGQWLQAEKYANILKKRHPSPKLSLILAKILQHNNQLKAAIHLLECQLQQSPLHIELYDYLAIFQEQDKAYYDALESAQKALKLTPSISHRALKVAQLAADLDRNDQVIKAGSSLANHLPIIDVDWIICLAEYMAIFEQLYFTQTSLANRQRLKIELQRINNRAHSRVMAAQKPFLTTYSHIVMSRLLLGNAQPLKAKRRMLLGLSQFFDKIPKLPSVVIADTLPLLVHFGETQLIRTCIQAIEKRNRFDGHSQNRLNDIKQQTHLAERIKQLETQLKEAFGILQTSPQQAFVRYQNIVHEYPLCSEANLGYLQCMLELNAGSEAEVKNSLKAISSMPLPGNLENWRKQVLEDMTSMKASPHQHKVALTYKKQTQRFLEAENTG
ncbi:response regulator [Photobacterium rosenbergii]|uniref:Response regulator n=1 Tax=Photobacterium rosenbergii TaxID=294936 RepID=A0ABU3ZKU2_9GAMM|nr:response regulator [Photobacterium rosenbergii]MDV5170744.1 response regulator [Photobacterium rosenbergii]